MGREKQRIDSRSLANDILLGSGTGHVEINALVKIARGCLRHAHVPYSNFAVGAAIVDDRGLNFTGANVENASYGLTMCAERVAIFSAIANGAKAIRTVVVSSAKARPVSPCGACRQVMAEFCEPNAMFFSDAGRGRIVSCAARDLLPYAFVGSALQQA